MCIVMFFQGTWHSAGKSNIYEWRDTSLQMESVSPENILETRPKSNHEAECGDTIISTIKPMSSILKSKDEKDKLSTNSGKCNNHTKPPDFNMTGLHEEKKQFINSPSNIYNYPASSIFIPRLNSIQSPHYKQDTKYLKYASNMPPHIPTATASPPYAKLINKSRVIKTAPVKINIINGSSSHRNKCFEGCPTKHNIRQSVPNIAISSSNFGNLSRSPVYRSSNQVLTSGMRSITVPVIPSCSDMKNKRKRYTPFRSSMSNVRNFEETGDMHYPGHVKKMKTCDPDDALSIVYCSFIFLHMFLESSQCLQTYVQNCCYGQIKDSQTLVPGINFDVVWYNLEYKWTSCPVNFPVKI